MDLFPDIFAAKRLRNGTATTAVDIAKTIASIRYGQVGTHVIAFTPVNGSSTINAGDTVAGSSLGYYRAVSANTFTGFVFQSTSITTPISSGTVPTGLSLVGTWRALTNLVNTGGSTLYIASLFIRIV
jgi:hypothetical protein